MNPPIMGVNKYFLFTLWMGLFAFPAGASPLKAQVFFQKGNAFLQTQQYDRAITAYTRAIALQPRFAHAHHKRGTAYYYSKQFKQACHDWKKACQLEQYCMGWNFGLYRKVCRKE